jgi:hypothetical protein
MSDLGDHGVEPAEDPQATGVGDGATAVADGYTVKLEGPGLTLERAVPSAVALQIVALAMSPGGAQPALPTGTSAIDAVRPGTTPVPGINHVAAQPTRQAVGEYVRSAGATKNAEKITAIGAWLHDQRAQQSFARDDVKAQFKNLGERPPQNWSRDFQSTVALGWIAPDHDEPNAFWVTKSGRDSIDAQFAGDAKPRIRRSRSRRKSTESASEKDGA